MPDKIVGDAALGVPRIFSEIILSKKYAHLYAPLIMRICREEYAKYKKDKDRIKAVKNKLHIIYGAFFSDECHKKAGAIIENVGANSVRPPLPSHNQTGEQSSPLKYRDISAEIMRLHASTNERLDILDEFYNFIFDITGQAESILDIGCGFNPFSIPFMKQDIKKYHAYDIDYRTVKLINNYFDLLNLPNLANCIDIIAETPRVLADVAFIFKLMPVIEAQKSGRAFEFLKEINAGYIAVTYPVKSLGGKNKGMSANYAKSFESGLDNFKIIKQKIIGNELIYVIKK